MRKVLIYIVCVTLASLVGAACGGESSDADAKRLKIGFIPNGISDFWKIAIAGVRAAERDFDVSVKVSQPTAKGRVMDQKSAMEDMISAGFAGIAISPIDPANQTPYLDKIASKTILITQDSDAPTSKRRCFIGVDNYKAGRLCGQLIREAIPDGGKIMLFVGGLEQANARGRRQGIIDELLGRSADPTRREPTGEAIRSPDGRFVILGCLTDSNDPTVAKDNAEDTLTKHADLACMVGLYEYNPPLLLQALQRAGRLKTVKVVGFDENKGTLQGIHDGSVASTVVQDPYMYGYESVRVLAALARGDQSVVPASGHLFVPAKRIDLTNVAAFEAELKSRLGN